MGADEKTANAMDKATGKLKEGLGKATGNERLEGEGKADQSAADLKKAGQHVKDAFKK